MATNKGEVLESCIQCGGPRAYRQGARGYCNACYLRQMRGEQPRPKQPRYGDDWRDRAACKGADHTLFFPSAAIGSGARPDNDTALAICQTCPVQQPCLDYALALRPRPDGIWGGTTESDRQRLRRRATA